MNAGTANSNGSQSEKSLLRLAKSTASDINKPQPIARKPVPSHPVSSRAVITFVAASGSAKGEKREMDATARQPIIFPNRINKRGSSSFQEVRNPAVPVYNFARYLTTAISPTQNRNIPNTGLARNPHPAIAMRIPAQREEGKAPSDSPLKGERNWCMVIFSNYLRGLQFYP